MKLPVPSFMTPIPGTLAASGTSPRSGSWLRERLWLVDLLVAIGVFLYNLPILPIYADGPVHAGALLAVSVALCAVYLFRRRFPAGVLGVMLLAASVQLFLGAPLLPVDAMLLFAVYNVATRHIWQVSIFGAALTVAWLLVAVIPHLGDDVVDLGQLGVLVVVTLWVWTWGTLVRVRRQFVEGLQGRAEQAERERETNAQIAVAQERARIAREIHDIVIRPGDDGGTEATERTSPSWPHHVSTPTSSESERSGWSWTSSRTILAPSGECSVESVTSSA